ncbi:hypothetical protein LB505_006302 [Fusarium chuoi]|nr:hypothetical protein LB505_006302 [Fusarium chuoi]
MAEFTKKTSFVEPGRNISKAGSAPFDRNPESKFYVLKSSISFPKSARDSELKAGFQILASDKESTTIYYHSWYADSTDIRFFHQGSGEVSFSNVTIYEGLADAWPER